MSDGKSPGQVKVTMCFSRHIGPTHVHGGLTLQFDSGRPYAFVSKVQWPGSDNYESAVREAVEEKLQSLQGSLDATLVVLTGIEWDEVASCALGFRKAAAAAVQAAFDV
jgi:hypothetical protein